VRLHGPAGGQGRRRRLDDDAEQLVVRLVAEHAESLLRLARRYSICPDDAHDAYQRSLEILMRHAARLDADRAGSWLRTVVKHEAMAINRSRRQIVGSADADLDGLEAREAPSPEDAVVAFERVERSAAALRQLKPQELRALWLRALGHSYDQIALTTGWSHTKVNRCLSEGRKSFLERYAGIEAGEECERLAPALSALVDGEAPGDGARELRSHLRVCGSCRASMRELHASARSVAAVFPLAGLTVADVAEPTHHFAVRLYEALSMGLSERTANTMLRAQAVIEAATASKLAAVAAASVAVTGGGIAVDRAVQSGRPPALARIVGRADALSLPVAATRAPPARRTARARPKAKAHRSRPRHRSHAAAKAPARAAAPAPRTVATTAAAPAPAPRPAPATPAPAAPAPAPTASSSSSSGSAAGEFGFEGG
jgi:RNA polymerase sigma factor (sigma-70 family)